MYIRLLGPVRVYVGNGANPGEFVAIGGGKPQMLLAALVSKRGTVVPVETLIDAVWGENPPSSARGLLHTYISGLRRALADAGSPGALVRVGAGYRLELATSEVDTCRFDALLTEARQLPPEAASARYTEALALCGGDVFGGVARGWLHAEAQRLSELRLTATGERIAADLAAGRAAELVPELTGLVRQHPLREQFWASLMLALWRGGRQADALRAFHDAAEALRSELGVDPGVELRAIFQSILDSDSPMPAARQLPAAAQRQAHSPETAETPRIRQNAEPAGAGPHTVLPSADSEVDRAAGRVPVPRSKVPLPPPRTALIRATARAGMPGGHLPSVPDTACKAIARKPLALKKDSRAGNGSARVTADPRVHDGLVLSRTSAPPGSRSTRCRCRRHYRRPRIRWAGSYSIAHNQ